MDGGGAVKTMRLRYAGACVGCDTPLPAGTRAHYLPMTRTVRCLTCGSTTTSASDAAAATSSPGHPPSSPSDQRRARQAPASSFVAWPTDASAVRPQPAASELSQGPLFRADACHDCERKLRAGTEALYGRGLTTVLCLECVTLDTIHSLGTPGAGARREHARRRDRHHTRVRTVHPRLGALILALADDPQHVRAWQTGAVGEEEFGRRLSGVAGPHLKVLHDRKLPRSRANIDHLAVTPETIWVLDAKRYKGKVETRGHGIFAKRPPELFVGGRNQTRLIAGVRKQVETVRAMLTPLVEELGIGDPPAVRGALVFTNAEFGLFSPPFTIDGVWVGWGRAMRKRFADQTTGGLPVEVIAKRLARALGPG